MAAGNVCLLGLAYTLKDPTAAEASGAYRALVQAIWWGVRAVALASPGEGAETVTVTRSLVVDVARAAQEDVGVDAFAQAWPESGELWLDGSASSIVFLFNLTPLADEHLAQKIAQPRLSCAVGASAVVADATTTAGELAELDLTSNQHGCDVHRAVRLAAGAFRAVVQQLTL